MTTIEQWIAPGNGNNVAPNSCWLDQQTSTINWQAKFEFMNSGGSLMVISGATCGIWDVTSGVSVGSLHFTGVNTININLNSGSAQNNHTMGLFVNYDSGTLPDHCLVTTTNTPGGGPHALFKIRRSNAWQPVFGFQLRIRRGGVWKPLSAVTVCSDGLKKGGFYVRRSGVWKTITSPW